MTTLDPALPSAVAPRADPLLRLNVDEPSPKWSGGGRFPLRRIPSPCLGSGLAVAIPDSLPRHYGAESESAVEILRSSDGCGWRSSGGSGDSSSAGGGGASGTSGRSSREGCRASGAGAGNGEDESGATSNGEYHGAGARPHFRDGVAHLPCPDSVMGRGGGDLNIADPAEKMETFQKSTTLMKAPRRLLRVRALPLLSR